MHVAEVVHGNGLDAEERDGFLGDWSDVLDENLLGPRRRVDLKFFFGLSVGERHGRGGQDDGENGHGEVFHGC